MQHKLRGGREANKSALANAVRRVILENLETRQLLTSATLDFDLLNSEINSAGETAQPVVVDLNVDSNSSDAPLDGSATGESTTAGSDAAISAGSDAGIDAGIDAGAAIDPSAELPAELNPEDVGGDAIAAAAQVAGASLSTAGVLTVTGNTSAANSIAVELDSSGRVAAKYNGVTKTFTKSSVKSIIVKGGDKNDYLAVTSKLTLGSTVYGQGGNDTVFAGSGADMVYGGAGNDSLSGRDGNDTLHGEDGNDFIDGGNGADSYSGGAGTNRYTKAETKIASPQGGTTTPTVPTTPTTTTGSATLAGGVLTVNGSTNSANTLAVELDSNGQVVATVNGNAKTFARNAVWSVVMRGGDQADTLSVTSKLFIPTTIYGQAGNDTVWGGSSADVVYGGPGNDSLSGRDGNDTLHGEDGDDFIDGGNGSDSYSGGSGTNRYTQAEKKIASPQGNNGGSTPSGGTGGESTPGGGTGSLPSAGSPSAVVTAIATSVTAGNAIHVHGLNSTLGGGSPTTAYYEWDFGDSGGAYNKLVGFNAAHIYSNPGNYTVTLKLTNEGGKVDTATRQVSIAGDNRRTIYVSAAGNDGNNGSSQGSAVKTINRVKSLIGSGDNVKVLFRRGDRFTLGTTASIVGDNVAFGAYGSGSLPTIFWDGPRDYRPILFFSGRDISVSDISFDTRFSGDREKVDMPDALSFSGVNSAVDGVEFLNVGNGLNNNAHPDGVLVQNSTAPSDIGLRSYFSWVEGNDHVYLGNRVANSTREATFRISEGAARVLVYGNEFTNRSRVSAGDRTDTSKNTLTIQWGSYAYIAHNKLNNGPVRVGPLGDGDGYQFFDSRFNYAVFDGNTFNAPAFTLHGASHVMWRNNISVANGYPAYEIESYNSSYGRGVTDVSLINNTVKNNDIKGKFVNVGSSVNGINLVNNLYVAPNLQPGSFQAAPVFVGDSDLGSFRTITNNVWSKGNPIGYAEGGMNYVWSNWSNSQGYQTAAEWNALPQVGTDLFSDVSVDGRFAPSGSSVAASAGRVYGGVFADFYGSPRSSSGPWTAGAVEV